eukprot:6849003-Prymnesium_polylepis.1
MFARPRSRATPPLDAMFARPWGDGAITRHLILAPNRGTSRSRSIVQMKCMDHTLHMLCSGFAHIEVD